MSKFDFGSSTKGDTYLSSINMYEGEISSKSLPTCQEDKCRATYQWKYANPDDCQFKFVCTVLSGNPCGEYGLELVGGSSDEIQVCSSNAIYKTTLKSGQTLSMNLWWISQAEFETKCYAWCSHRGSHPTKSGEDTELDDLIIEKAVRSYKFGSVFMFQNLFYPQ